MKHKLASFALFVAITLLTVTYTIAQQVVNPGHPVIFTQPTERGAKVSDEKLAAAAFVPPYTIQASAAVVNVAGKETTAQAYAYNDFKVSGNVPRVLAAQVSANVEWRGALGAAGVIGTNASVKIILTWHDLTDGHDLTKITIHDKSIGGSLVSGDVDFKDSDSAQVTLQANVIRGHTYRLLFQIDCKADSGVGGIASSVYFPGNPIGATGATMTNLALLISGDVFELLDTIDTKLNQALTQLNTLQTSVNLANTRLTSVEAKVDVANNNLNIVNNKLDARLDVAVSTRASQTSVNVLTGKVDDLFAALEAFKKQSLRAQIEAALVEGDRYNVTWFQMPEVAGGYLELVRSIVKENLEGSRKAILSPAINYAEKSLALGDTYLAAKLYKDAYSQYRTAYLYLSLVLDGHRP